MHPQVLSILNLAQCGALAAAFTISAPLTSAQTPDTPITPAQPTTTEPANPKNTPDTPEKKKDTTRVSILGYHEFSATKSATAMRLPTATFRKQMQAIKDQGLNVISMEDFLAWKRGDKQIPDKSILITIDDGWKSVYTDAFPILKEFKFPFTVFLYKNYVDGGGRALTTPMIKEMMKHGCTVGGHSTSHPLPSKVKRAKRKGKETFAKFLQVELGDSKTFLERKFGVKVTTYAYPGGYHTEEMYEKAKTLGYKCLFTVAPGKTTIDKNNSVLPRYIIQGTHDYIFDQAIAFRSLNNQDPSTVRAVRTPHPVSPKSGESISNRAPLIYADLSQVENIDPDSLVMRIAGLGKVPVSYDPESKQASWQVNRPIRTATCEVSLQWKLLKQEKYEPIMKWTFLVDREASYQPTTAPTLPDAPTTPR